MLKITERASLDKFRMKEKEGEKKTTQYISCSVSVAKCKSKKGENSYAAPVLVHSSPKRGKNNTHMSNQEVAKGKTKGVILNLQNLKNCSLDC